MTDLISSLYDFAEDGSRDRFLELFNGMVAEEIEEQYDGGNIYLTDSKFRSDLASMRGIANPIGDGIQSFLTSATIEDTIHVAYKGYVKLFKEDLKWLPTSYHEFEMYVEAYEKNYKRTFKITNSEIASILVNKYGCLVLPLIGSLDLSNPVSVGYAMRILEKCKGEESRYLDNIAKSVIESRHVVNRSTLAYLRGHFVIRDNRV